MLIDLKCCNLIGAATVVAARMSEVHVSHQTHRLCNRSDSARLAFSIVVLLTLSTYTVIVYDVQ